jgi:ATP-dependent RNA helicase DDX42
MSYSFIFLGEKGFAYTLLTEKDKDFAGHLVRNLEAAGQHVPHALIQLAEKVIHMFW